MNEKFREQLGDPDIKISGLEIWIHGRQFPDTEDYWDGNWLRVTVHCSADSSSVWANGTFIHLPELYGWYESTLELNDSLKGSAHLDCMEPNLSAIIKAKSLGQLTMEVNITPNHLEQEHKYLFELDQSYLPGFLSGCKKVLEKYPVKGINEANGT